MATAKESAKETAHRIIGILPDHATWDDILYALYVRQKIELGLTDAETDRTVSHHQLKEALLSDKDFEQ